MSGALQHAQQHSGDSGDEGIFSSVLGFLGQNKQHIGQQEVDEQRKYSLSTEEFHANIFKTLSSLTSNSLVEEETSPSQPTRAPWELLLPCKL